MAPEQLEGREADARTDIFAFGAVVYEMVTGKKAFEGKSQASLIGAIMNSEPASMSNLQPMSPLVLDRIVKKCLAKDPDSRWHSAHDLHDELQWIADAGSQVGVPTSTLATPQRAGWRRSMPLALGALVVGSFLTGLAVWTFTRQPTRPVARFVVGTSATEPLAPSGGQRDLAISPDGSHIVYRAGESGALDLYLRPVDQLDGTRLYSAARDLSNPFFSPDGMWVGFSTKALFMTVWRPRTRSAEHSCGIRQG